MTERTATFDAAAWRRRLRVALGAEPADLVLAGGTIVDVLAGDTYIADVAIADGTIAGIGEYPLATERIDVSGQWVAPAYIDAHMHTERTLVWLTEFARAVVPHGT
jgi:adenine deaminase